MSFHINITDNQRAMLRIIFPPLLRKLRRHDPFDILEAIFYIVYTGCQWSRLPAGYPPYPTVYYHYRSWSCGPHLDTALRVLVNMRRMQCGQARTPTVAVIDSQSVRTGLPQAVSGIDGGKRVKGIKRHIAVDKNGYVLGADVTPANVHDSKGADRLMANVLSHHENIRLIKADLGYRGAFTDMPLDEFGIEVECVKSNFGSADFIPVKGRWVVERSFSWLQNYRRLMRNYEQHLYSARYMTLFAMVFFMLRYFA